MDETGPHNSAKARRGRIDPRLFQIAALSALLAFGILSGAIRQSPGHAAAAFAAAVATQFIFARTLSIPFEMKSALISALSISLLLRTDHPLWMALAAMIAIGSKHLLRIDGKHVFNPANAGIVGLLITSAAPWPAPEALAGVAWTTPGQWGAAATFAALLAGVGTFITARAARLDVPATFLLVYGALMIGRALWLGDPLTIPLHRLQNGALILFAFFMISDPKTTPDDRFARIVFCAAAAALAFVLQHRFFISDGLFYALAAACLLRPALERVRPAARFSWMSVRSAKTANEPDLTPQRRTTWNTARLEHR